MILFAAILGFGMYHVKMIYFRIKSSYVIKKELKQIVWIWILLHRRASIIEWYNLKLTSSILCIYYRINKSWNAGSNGQSFLKKWNSSLTEFTCKHLRKTARHTIQTLEKVADRILSLILYRLQKQENPSP